MLSVTQYPPRSGFGTSRPTPTTPDSRTYLTSMSILMYGDHVSSGRAMSNDSSFAQLLIFADEVSFTEHVNFSIPISSNKLKRLSATVV